MPNEREDTTVGLNAKAAAKLEEEVKALRKTAAEALKKMEPQSVLSAHELNALPSDLQALPAPAGDEEATPQTKTKKHRRVKSFGTLF